MLPLLNNSNSSQGIFPKLLGMSPLPPEIKIFVKFSNLSAIGLIKSIALLSIIKTFISE